jgi:hypothetical protein
MSVWQHDHTKRLYKVKSKYFPFEVEAEEVVEEEVSHRHPLRSLIPLPHYIAVVSILCWLHSG